MTTEKRKRSKDTRKYLKQILSPHGNEKGYKTAQEMLNELGFKVINAFSEALDDEDPKVRLFAAKELIKYIFPAKKDISGDVKQTQVFRIEVQEFDGMNLGLPEKTTSGEIQEAEILE